MLGVGKGNPYSNEMVKFQDLLKQMCEIHHARCFICMFSSIRI